MSANGTGIKVLLVDDDDTFRRVMSRELGRKGFIVESAATGRDALSLALEVAPDVILLDLRLPDMDGILVLEKLHERDVPGGVIVLTGHGTIDTAIKATRLGAYDYLEKPCPIAKVEMTIRKTFEHADLVARQKVLQDGYTPPDVRRDFIGRSPAFERLCHDISRIAGTDASTLIVGETGVGKDMVATMLHTQSKRSEAPFVVVDCAALHEELLQNELFGHEKGAFSGATRLKHGLFEVADGGTLFLDEVGDTSPDTQAKLLRALESGRFRRLGGTREISVDVRVLSATNRDLEKDLASGQFREDLYFRLAALTLRVPPLRERREDIPLLVEHFTGRLNKRLSRSYAFDAEAMRILVAHPWPGNVRELLHVVEHAVLLADHPTIGAEDLPREVLESRGAPRDGEAPLDLGTLEEVQRQHVLEVLSACRGNRARAARILGISERNLYRLIRRYDPAAEGRGKPTSRSSGS